ncbi:MAG TPA: flagellar biosynthesis protein FlhF [Pyrinomonadaceae bacterium]|nr:flagellar biosynthesis protein FlhF [Pyrinomonadaceae bacterium]
MNIKKYQAPTMREALEQVKQDLGEEALVLETKKVRSRSFLGMGGQELVEVRAAADETNAQSGPKSPAKKARRENGLTLLHLTDDAPATPTSLTIPANPHPRAERLSAPAFTALAARAAALTEQTERIDSLPSSPTTFNSLPRGVELAETPPRLVHRPAAKPAAAHSSNASSAPAINPPLDSLAALLQQPRPAAPAPNVLPAGPANNSVSVELERLRAELREVKFSINSLAARPAASEEHKANADELFDNDPEIYPSPFYEAFQELSVAGLSAELAHRAVRAAILSGLRDEQDPVAIARYGLRQFLPSFIDFAPDLFETTSLEVVSPASHSAVVFVGPTGVGKTTTIAKLAARLALREKRRVELITLDTYRIAAVEQLKTYAEIIGTRCHVARSVVEVDALTRRFAGEASVLIDTVGRSPHDLADQMELADYLRSSEDIAKCLVLQATTHPHDALAAVRKFALYGASHLALTKLDETARPAASLSVAADAGLPLAYLCHGQRVPEDLERATPETYAARLVRAALQ